MEDQPLARPIKEKKKGDKPPSLKMIMTGSANLVLIVSMGPVRPMQIPVGSLSALPASQDECGQYGKGQQASYPHCADIFSKECTQSRSIEVKYPQIYTFPKKSTQSILQQLHIVRKVTKSSLSNSQAGRTAMIIGLRMKTHSEFIRRLSLMMTLEHIN